MSSLFKVAKMPSLQEHSHGCLKRLSVGHSSSTEALMDMGWVPYYVAVEKSLEY